MGLIQIGAPAFASDNRVPGAVAEAPDFHFVEGEERVLFGVRGSRLFVLPDDVTDADALESLGLSTATAPAPQVMGQPVALSLNIAQSCNLSCGYCYADEGRFGGSTKLMSLETAKEAIFRHIWQAERGPVSIGFIGGEPLLNRELLHTATRFAANEAARRRIAITFGITTNGTLLREEDIELLRAYSFAVTVSMDGARETHDALRPTRRGSGSFDQAVAGIAPLLANPGRASIAARVTVTRQNLQIGAHIDSLAEAGFGEIGVSPVRTGPDPALCISGADWVEYLGHLKAAAMADWVRVRGTGLPLRFSNLSTAVRQLYRGACNALPCGAAASYVSLDADGHYYTCHRTVGDHAFDLGNTRSGPSLAKRQTFAESRAVDRQEPCRSCWARYLCGGGCHFEVIKTGREGCDAIRGWLEFCISLYPEMLAQRPDLLTTKTGATLS